MKTNMFLLVGAIVLGQFVSLAGAQPAPTKPEAEPAKPGPVTPAPATPAEADKAVVEPVKPAVPPEKDVAVVIDGKDVMESEVIELFDTMLKFQLRGRPLPEAQRNQILQQRRGQILDMIIETKLLDRQVEAEGITVTDEQLAAELEAGLQAHLSQTNKTREELDQDLQRRAQRSLDEALAEQLADPRFKQSVLYGRMLRKKFPEKTTVTDQEIKDFFAEQGETLVASRSTVRASHILLKTTDDMTAEKRAELHAKLEGILEEAKSGKAEFEALAKEHSQCSSAMNGGDLGSFPKRGKMVDAFADAAFALKVGEVSDIVETQFGFHIIKLTGRNDFSLESATLGIKKMLEDRKLQEAHQSYVEELRAAADIKYPPGKEPKAVNVLNMNDPKFKPKVSVKPRPKDGDDKAKPADAKPIEAKPAAPKADDQPKEPVVTEPQK